MNAFSYLFPHGKSFLFDLLKSFARKANMARSRMAAKLWLLRQATSKAGNTICALCLSNFVAFVAVASSNSTHH